MNASVINQTLTIATTTPHKGASQPTIKANAPTLELLSKEAYKEKKFN